MQHNVPVRIAHSHNANQDRNLKYPIKLWCRRSIPRCATHLFACGKDAGDWMFGGAPYQIINNAIDVTTYAALMQAMDGFAFPSLSEGLPGTMVDAQAAGLPCIISDKVPTECILTEGLVDIMPLSASPEAWAEKILAKRAIPRTDRRAEIAAHGFDITTEAVKLQEFYLKAYEQNC